MDKLRAQKMYELANRLSQVDSTSLSESQHAEYTAMLEQLQAEAAKLKQGVAEGEIEQQHGDIKPWAYWGYPERVAKKLYQIHRGAPIDKSAIVQLWKEDGPDRMTKFMLKPDVAAILSAYEQMSDQGPMFKQGVAEVSQQTLQSYRKKAAKQKSDALDVTDRPDTDDATWVKNINIASKRKDGIAAANKRLGVAEGTDQDDPYKGTTPTNGKVAARNGHRLGKTYNNPHSPKYHKDSYAAWDRDYNKETARLKKQGLEEGVATSMPLSDAVKLLKHYGADHFKTTSNELHFYKNGQAFSVDLVMNPDTTRSATLSSLNSATRGLKGQGVTEDIDTEAYDRLKRVFDFSDYKG